LEVIVRTSKQTNRQTNRRRRKHPPRFATLYAGGEICLRTFWTPQSRSGDIQRRTCVLGRQVELIDAEYGRRRYPDERRTEDHHQNGGHSITAEVANRHRTRARQHETCSPEAATDASYKLNIVADARSGD